MQTLLNVILPVFLVLGFGYVAVWRGWMTDNGIEGLMRFTQGFAIPCLLFRAIASLDLSQEFDLAMLASFYTGATTGFVVAMLGARFLFGRPWEDSVAIGFCGLFSNSVMLGLPIAERAYGADSLAGNFAIVALHAPFCYALGITTMEIVRNRGGNLRGLPKRVATAMFRNALVIGILLGFGVNLLQIPLPGVLISATDLMVRAAIPVALFALGGVLYRYRPEGDMRTILFVCAVSLVVHPAVAFGTGTLLGLDDGAMRSAVLMAAMATGVNGYVFASMYGVAKRVAASSVLIGTGLAILTVWGWLAVLP